MLRIHLFLSKTEISSKRVGTFKLFSKTVFNQKPCRPLKVLLWRNVKIWINLLEFVKLLFLKWINYANQSVQRWLLGVVLNATNFCEPQRELCDMKTLRLTNDLWRKTFWQAYTCIAALQNLRNTCQVNYTPLPITHVSNKGLSADSLPSNRRTFYSGINLIFNCEVIKTESSDRW